MFDFKPLLLLTLAALWAGTSGQSTILGGETDISGGFSLGLPILGFFRNALLGGATLGGGWFAAALGAAKHALVQLGIGEFLFGLGPFLLGIGELLLPVFGLMGIGLLGAAQLAATLYFLALWGLGGMWISFLKQSLLFLWNSLLGLGPLFSGLAATPFWASLGVWATFLKQQLLLVANWVRVTILPVVIGLFPVPLWGWLIAGRTVLEHQLLLLEQFFVQFDRFNIFAAIIGILTHFIPGIPAAPL